MFYSKGSVNIILLTSYIVKPYQIICIYFGRNESNTYFSEHIEGIMTILFFQMRKNVARTFIKSLDMLLLL